MKIKKLNKNVKIYLINYFDCKIIINRVQGIYKIIKINKYAK